MNKITKAQAISAHKDGKKVVAYGRTRIDRDYATLPIHIWPHLDISVFNSLDGRRYQFEIIESVPEEPVTVIEARPEAPGFRIPAPPADVVPGIPTSGTTYPVFESKAEIAAAMAEPKAPATEPAPALALAYASSDLDAPRTPSPSRVLFKQAHGAARLGWDLSNLPEAIQRAARTARRPGHLERRVHDAYRTLRTTFRGRPEAFRAFIRANAGVDAIIPPT